MTIVPPFQDDAKGIDKQDSEETREFVKDLILTELQDFLSSEGLKKLVDQFTRSLLKDSKSAEEGLRDGLNTVALHIMGGAYEGADDFGPTVEVDGKSYHKVDATTGEVTSLFGKFAFERSRYRPSGKGSAIVPVEQALQMSPPGLTSAATELTAFLAAYLPLRETEEVWGHLVDTGPSVSTVSRLTTELGRRWEKTKEAGMQEIREQEEIPETATTLSVSLDGVMISVHAEGEGENKQKAGYHEAACGVVSLHDAKGERLVDRYFGCMPEHHKVNLRTDLFSEVFHLLKQRKDLKVVAIADGAVTNWSYFSSLQADVEVLDYWHMAQHLKDVDQAAFPQGDGTWFETWKGKMLDDENGAEKVIRAIARLDKAHPGNATIERELNFFKKNKYRMQYKSCKDAALPIGSGPVEAANKTLIKIRMKRCGQRWTKAGGQAVLSLRSLVKSDRFDSAMAKIRGTFKTWAIGKSANINTEPKSMAA